MKPLLLEAETIQLRAVEEGDQDFLLELLASTRPDLRLADSPAHPTLLRMQFDFQVAHNRSLYPRLEICVILADGQRAGRMYMARGPHEIRVVDISLLPEFRLRRIGGRLLAHLQEESRRCGLPLRLQVLQDDAVQPLYHRHSFPPGQAEGLHQPMESTPS